MTQDSAEVSQSSFHDAPVLGKIVGQRGCSSRCVRPRENGSDQRQLQSAHPLRGLAEAKEKLKPALSEGNVAKTMAAPRRPSSATTSPLRTTSRTFPARPDARSWFAGKDKLIETTAFRNGTLQSGYFILAARALGLDCGPMSGFENAKVDEAFFAGTTIRSNFLCNIGYGDASKLRPRNERLAFEEACRIA